MPDLDIQNHHIDAFGPSTRVVPRLVVQARVRNDIGIDLLGLEVIGELWLFGSRILSSPPVFRDCFRKHAVDEFRFEFLLSTLVIDAIENYRSDDVPMQLRMGMQYCVEENDRREWTTTTLVRDMKQSQKEWLDILRSLEYSEHWTIEMARPHIVGFDKMEEHLTKARDCIQGRDYEGAMHNCRVAWNSVEPLLKGLVEKLNAEIDRDSPGESGQPAKSGRTWKVKEAVKSLSQIGAHKESYVVKPQDALLCYRLTVSLASYLSFIASAVEES